MKRVLLGMIAAYQRWVSPAFPRRCKYEPTCSAYAAQAVRELGPVRGAIVAGWRLLRCNPLSDGGIDDLRDRSLFRDRAGSATAAADHAHPHHGPADRPGTSRARRRAAGVGR